MPADKFSFLFKKFEWVFYDLEMKTLIQTDIFLYNLKSWIQIKLVVKK